MQSVSSVLCWPSFYPGRELGTTPYGFDKCIQFPLFTKSLISSIEVDDGTSTLVKKLLEPARSNEAKNERKRGKESQLEMRFSPTGLLMQISLFSQIHI